jgi:hypothetical protein
MPEFGSINSKYSELDVSIEVPMNEVRQMKSDQLVQLFRKLALDCMLSTGKRYNLDTTALHNF